MQVESSWASHQPGDLQIEQFSTEAGAKLRPITLYRTINNAPQDSTVELAQGPKPWDNIAEHSIACILDGAECQAPLRHGLIVQEIFARSRSPRTHSRLAHETYAWLAQRIKPV